MKLGVKSEHIWLGLAFAAMILVPWYLLTREPQGPPEPEPLRITKINPQEIVVVDTLIDKPIFNPDRAPTARSEEIPAEEEMLASEAEEPAPSNPLPTLVGLVSKKRGKAVAIVKGMEGRTETLRRGQSIDGWRLVSISRSAAVFDGVSGRQTARLDYRNKALGGPASDTDTPSEPIQNGENE